MACCGRDETPHGKGTNVKACSTSRCRTFRRLLHWILSFNSTCSEETGQTTRPAVHNQAGLEQYFSGSPAEEGPFLSLLWCDGGPSNCLLCLLVEAACTLCNSMPVLHWYRPGEHHRLGIGATIRSQPTILYTLCLSPSVCVFVCPCLGLGVGRQVGGWVGG